MNTERQIEFDKVRDIWAELAVTGYAKERIEAAKVILEEKDLRKELRDTTDAKEMIENLGNPPLQNVTEIREILEAAAKGDCLTPYQLERVERVLVAVERLMDYLKRGQQFGNPLAYYDENLNPLYELKDEINRQIRNEMVEDRATKELFDIRNSIVNLEDTMKQKAEQIMRSNKDCMADSYYTMRNGRVCVPVKKEYKFKIPGSTIDKSATGNTIGKYVTEKRLFMARAFLEQGLSVTEACYKSGFKNYAAFYYAYRKKYASPPAQGRNAEKQFEGE